MAGGAKGIDFERVVIVVMVVVIGVSDAAVIAHEAGGIGNGTCFDGIGDLAGGTMEHGCPKLLA